jgi:hypothetical protein
MAVWIILTGLTISTLIIMLAMSLSIAYEELNQLRDHKPIVLTRFDKHPVDHNHYHHLYQCRSQHPKWCKDCPHQGVHEKTPECDTHGCELCVAVYN